MITEYFAKRGQYKKLSVVETRTPQGKYRIEGDPKWYSSYSELREAYKEVRAFTKEERSSFKYWFAHWCAFQMTALNLGCWKLRFLFHDFEKPWLKLVWSYKKVQKFHRTHSKHHLEYGRLHGWNKLDVLGLIVDWECCGYTKVASPLDAFDTLEMECSEIESEEERSIVRNLIMPKIKELGL